MLRHRRGSRAALLILLCGGCMGRPEPDAAAVVDSAGVRIVTNGADAVNAAREWTLSPTPVVEVGSGADPGVALFRVMAVTPLPGDRVAIGMTAPPQVLIANPDGTPAAVLGGEGEGPGEFAGVRSVVRLEPDSLAVWDAERRRLSVFTEDGRLQRDLNLADLAPLSWIASPDALSESGRIHVLPSAPGSFVLMGVGVFGPGDGVRRVTVPSYRVAGDGTPVGRLRSFPGETTFFSDQTGVAPYPLGPDTHGAALGDRLVVGLAQAEEFRRYAVDGRLELIVRWASADTAVSGPRLDAWSAFVAQWLDAMPPQELAAIRDILEAVPQPGRFPAYTGVVTSSAGETWVGAYHPGQLELGVAFMGRPTVPSRRWLVFGEDGVITATARTPAGFRPFAVHEGRVWGVHTDELGVESVRAYEIIR